MLCSYDDIYNSYLLGYNYGCTILSKQAALRPFPEFMMRRIPKAIKAGFNSGLQLGKSGGQQFINGIKQTFSGIGDMGRGTTRIALSPVEGLYQGYNTFKNQWNKYQDNLQSQHILNMMKNQTVTNLANYKKPVRIFPYKDKKYDNPKFSLNKPLSKPRQLNDYATLITNSFNDTPTYPVGLGDYIIDKYARDIAKPIL